MIEEDFKMEIVNKNYTDNKDGKKIHKAVIVIRRTLV